MDNRTVQTSLRAPVQNQIGIIILHVGLRTSSKALKFLHGSQRLRKSTGGSAVSEALGAHYSPEHNREISLYQRNNGGARTRVVVSSRLLDVWAYLIINDNHQSEPLFA